MTLDQSLANLQHQADRLAGHFARISDSIESEGHPYVGADPVAAYAKGVSDAMKPQVAVGPVEVMARGDHWDHTHEGGKLVYHGEGQAVPMAPTAAEAAVLANPHISEAIEKTFAGTAQTVQADWRDQTPQGAAPSSAPPMAAPPASAVEVEGPGVSAPEAPRPAGPNPFDSEAALAAAPLATEKKKGRRTHEQLCEDNGVTLAEVKAWLGPDKKVTKAAIEEAGKLKKANAVGETPAQAAITTPPDIPYLPQTAENPIGITTPPDGSHLPQAVSDPFGNPGTPPPAAPAPQWPTGPDGQPLPVSQPVAQAQGVEYHAAVPPTPDNPFGQTPENPWAGEQPVTDWSPFQ